MPRQLPADCLNEIFEYLENDKATLHSCLLINRLWCEVSVRILWRSVWNYSTLIVCLPNDSKEILFKNKILISSPTSKPPLFNYIAFIKGLSVDKIGDTIKNILKNYRSITPQNLNYKKCLVAQEIFKMFMQLSLKEIYFFGPNKIPNIAFTSYPGAKNCLKNLTKLHCCSDIYPEFFYQLSQMCHNIQDLRIIFQRIISNGLTDLISVQQNLKHLEITQPYDNGDLTNIISSLTKLPNTLVKLNIYGRDHYIPLLFIAKFTNLQELILSFYYSDAFKDFKELQYVTFSQLQILKFQFGCPRDELLIKFLENNGKSLKEFHVGDNSNSLNLAISKFCPNIRNSLGAIN